MPKHILSSVREQSALEVAKDDLRRSLESDAFYGGKESLLELLKPFLKRVLEDTMQVELSEYLQAAKSERTEQRRGYRNGSREVTIKSSTLGLLELSVLRDRDGNFHPRLLEKCPRVEQSMVIALCEGYALGLSTRNVTAFLNRLGLGNMSKTQMSRLRTRMDGSGRLRYLNSRPSIRMHMRDTCDFDSAPNPSCVTIATTLRVDNPSTKPSMMPSNIA